jgi:hypothetical protein
MSKDAKRSLKSLTFGGGFFSDLLYCGVIKEIKK